jgi:hypothetical protein
MECQSLDLQLPFRVGINAKKARKSEILAIAGFGGAGKIWQLAAAFLLRCNATKLRTGK